nr:hypothetical protein [Ardenticatena sp.]
MSHHRRLAYVDDHRWVALCPHGLLHIRWNYFSFHLPVSAFRQLLNVLVEGTGKPFDGPVQKEAYRLVFRDDGLFQLHVGMCVCWFSVMDMILFRNMLLLANGALAQANLVEEPTNAPPIDSLIDIPFSTN